MTCSVKSGISWDVLGPSTLGSFALRCGLSGGSRGRVRGFSVASLDLVH